MAGAGWQRILTWAGLAGLVTACAGCPSAMSYLATQKESGNKRQGVVFYVGGAGPIGHVGSWDVPEGLRDGGYEGYVRVFAWQGVTHVGDQIDLQGNRGKGMELKNEIVQFHWRYPQAPILIIALSAGTGIATFALEYLPQGVKVNNVVFVGCSLSSRYDLTRALKRVKGGMYALQAPNDIILKDLVWATGTVDRRSAEEGVAGLTGFREPVSGGPDTEREYRKLHNVPYRNEFARYGFSGGHTGGVSRKFVQCYLTDVILGEDGRLVSGAWGRAEDE